MMGEFDRDTFSTSGSVVLFVAYVLLVDVVLLNVLIAVVSDSYEKGLSSARKVRNPPVRDDIAVRAPPTVPTATIPTTPRSDIYARPVGASR